MHRMQPPPQWMRKKKEASWHIVFKYCTCCRHTRYASFVFYTRCEWSQQINACLKFTSHIDELPFIRFCRSCKMNKNKNEKFKNSWAQIFCPHGFELRASRKKRSNYFRFKCRTNGVQSSKDRKILYYFDKYQIERENFSITFIDLRACHLLSLHFESRTTWSTLCTCEPVEFGWNFSHTSSSSLLPKRIFRNRLATRCVLAETISVRNFCFHFLFLSRLVSIFEYLIRAIFILFLFSYINLEYFCLRILRSCEFVCGEWVSPSIYYHKFVFNLFRDLQIQNINFSILFFRQFVRISCYLIPRIRTDPQLEITIVLILVGIVFGSALSPFIE